MGGLVLFSSFSSHLTGLYMFIGKLLWSLNPIIYTPLQVSLKIRLFKSSWRNDLYGICSQDLLFIVCYAFGSLNYKVSYISLHEGGCGGSILTKETVLREKSRTWFLLSIFFWAIYFLHVLRMHFSLQLVNASGKQNRRDFKEFQEHLPTHKKKMLLRWPCVSVHHFISTPPAAIKNEITKQRVQ